MLFLNKFSSHSATEVSPIFLTPCCKGIGHKFVQKTIGRILSRHFKPISNFEDFYFYSPPVKTEEPASVSVTILWTILRMKQSCTMFFIRNAIHFPIFPTIIMKTWMLMAA